MNAALGITLKRLCFTCWNIKVQFEIFESLYLSNSRIYSIISFLLIRLLNDCTNSFKPSWLSIKIHSIHIEPSTLDSIIFAIHADVNYLKTKLSNPIALIDSANR